MAKFPRQCRWADFVRLVQSLGYEGPFSRAGAGSARYFTHPTRAPRLAVFHQPHPHSTIPLGTLRAYVERLALTREEFLHRMREL